MPRVVDEALSIIYPFLVDKNEGKSIQPPHCTSIEVKSSIPSRSNWIDFLQHYPNFQLGIHNTACFQITKTEIERTGGESAITPNSSKELHTIQFAKLEHEHNVNQKYEFAIPEVDVSCICECSKFAHCKSDISKKCPTENQQNACYRSIFYNQPTNGCESRQKDGVEPRLCCEIKLKPYQNEIYTALSIGQPTTFATFIYAVYEFKNGKWEELEKRTIRAQVGNPQDKDLNKAGDLGMSVSAGGTILHELDRAIYYTPKQEDAFSMEIHPMPNIAIGARQFDQLGWFRKEDGHFVAKNIENVHTAIVTECKRDLSIYKTTLDAKYYKPGNFTLPRSVKDQHLWIENATYDGKRTVTIAHREGANVQITLKVKSKVHYGFQFKHNHSSIDDFSGMIIVDKQSNRYLNLTAINVYGQFNGDIKENENDESDPLYSFTKIADRMYPMKNWIVPLPSNIEGGSRTVCVLINDYEHRAHKGKCHVIPYNEEPLDNVCINVDITREQSTSQEPEDESPSIFARALDFLADLFSIEAWTKKPDDLKELLALVARVLICILLFFIIYKSIKIILPLLKCCSWCYGSCSNKKSSDRQDIVVHINPSALQGFSNPNLLTNSEFIIPIDNAKFSPKGKR